jgi:hypothetical protein
MSQRKLREPDFQVGESGTPGDDRALFIPTTPGVSTFHLTGSIKGQPVDQKFTSGPTIFDEVRDPAEVSFPTKDPTTGQLSARLDRKTKRLTGDGGQQQTRKADDTAGTPVSSPSSGWWSPRYPAPAGFSTAQVGLSRPHLPH